MNNKERERNSKGEEEKGNIGVELKNKKKIVLVFQSEIPTSERLFR